MCTLTWAVLAMQRASGVWPDVLEACFFTDWARVGIEMDVDGLKHESPRTYKLVHRQSRVHKGLAHIGGSAHHAFFDV